jgi:ribosomal protein L11 methyltransferase
VSRPRLSLRLAAADVPKAEALLELAGAETIALRDAADDPVFEPEPSTAPLWPTVVVEALFAAGTEVEPLRLVLASTFRDSAATVETVDESVWQRRLAEVVKARPIGTRLWLAPADDSDLPPRWTRSRSPEWPLRWRGRAGWGSSTRTFRSMSRRNRWTG